MASSRKKSSADAQTDLASVKLIPLLSDSIKANDGASLSLEFPSVAGDKEKVDEQGQRVYEEALFHGGFDRGDRLSLVVASRLEAPSYFIKGGVGGERGSPGGAAASSVFSIACVDPDAPGGVWGSSANGKEGESSFGFVERKASLLYSTAIPKTEKKNPKKSKILKPAPWLHQLIVDAPGPDPSRGRELCPWVPPSPPKELHRCEEV